MSFLSPTPLSPPSGASSKFFQVPRSIYGESNSFIFLHIFFIFLHNLFIFPSYFFILFSSYFWDLEKFRSLPLNIDPGILKDSDLFSYIWALALGKNLSYFIYGHETCFYCRDLSGNLLMNLISGMVQRLRKYTKGNYLTLLSRCIKSVLFLKSRAHFPELVVIRGGEIRKFSN